MEQLSICEIQKQSFSENVFMGFCSSQYCNNNDYTTKTSFVPSL